MLQQGSYIIKSKLTNECIDSDTNVGKQFDWQHPRVFMSYPNIHKQSHIWYIQKCNNDHYLLTDGSGKALDSNLHAPQHSNSCNTPFMWNITPDASNHRWILEPSGEHDTFYLISESNGKALTANGTIQIDPMHRTVFLSDINRRSDDMKWILQRVETGQQQHSSVPPNSQYSNTPPVQQNYSSGGSYNYSSGGGGNSGGNYSSGGGSSGGSYSGGGSNNW